MKPATQRTLDRLVAAGQLIREGDVYRVPDDSHLRRAEAALDRAADRLNVDGLPVLARRLEALVGHLFDADPAAVIDSLSALLRRHVAELAAHAGIDQADVRRVANIIGEWR